MSGEVAFVFCGIIIAICFVAIALLKIAHSIDQFTNALKKP